MPTENCVSIGFTTLAWISDALAAYNNDCEYRGVISPI